MIIMLATGCQDHHFLPMDKAGDIKMQSEKESSGRSGKSFEESEYAQKEVMAQAGQRGTQYDRLIVEGTLDLGPEHKERDFSGYTVYVIAWPSEEQGPPIAVERYDGVKFPLSYRLDESTLMGGVFPGSDWKILVEARLDRDGDPMSKEKGDVYGITKNPVKPGGRNVDILLQFDRL